jgi:hypothetical protein
MAVLQDAPVIFIFDFGDRSRIEYLSTVEATVRIPLHILNMVSNIESKNFNENLTPSSSTSSVKKIKMGLKKFFAKPTDKRMPASEVMFENVRFRMM